MAIPLGTLATRQTLGRWCAAASRIECTTAIGARRCVEMTKLLQGRSVNGREMACSIFGYKTLASEICYRCD